MKRIVSIILFIVLGFVLHSCRHTPTIPNTPQISFQNDVQPIIINSCATTEGCHGGSGRRLKLQTYDDVSGYVSAGDAHNSKLYQVITGKGLATLMPPKNSSQGPLNDEQIKVIYLWIMQGAKNN